MILTKVYYDYFDGEKAPIWFVIDIKKSEVDWEKDILLVPIQAPFESYDSDEFDHSAINISITMSEITSHILNNHIGINLDLIRARCLEYDLNPKDISNFILLVADIEEVLRFAI